MKVLPPLSIAIVCSIMVLFACSPGRAAEQPAPIVVAPAGVGMVVMRDKNRFLVEFVLPDMPAAKAQIQIGEEILAVDDVSTQNYKTVDEIVGKIRGQTGSKVKLKLQNGNQIRELTIVRGAIPSPQSQGIADFGREVSVHFYQFEDLVPDTESKYTFMGHDYSVAAFLRRQLNRR